MDGPITLRARAQMPRSWAALAGTSFYGPDQLQGTVDFVKATLFATVVDAATEFTYDPRVTDYAGKVVAINVIPAAVEYWTGVQTSITTEANARETKSFPDRITPLWRLREELQKDVERMTADFERLAGRDVHRYGSVPEVNTVGPLRTPDPSCFPRLRQGTRNGLLPWGADSGFWVPAAFTDTFLLWGTGA